MPLIHNTRYQCIRSILQSMLTCYCIASGTSPTSESLETIRRTYVGATNDFRRRIRQHNREIVGGARATHGHTWHPLFLVQGFATRHELLSFEWWWKHVARVRKSEVHQASHPVYRRIDALEYLLRQESWGHLSVYCGDVVAAMCDIERLYDLSLLTY